MIDDNTLAALVAYAQEALFAYEVALAKAPLSQTERATLAGFGAEARATADALRKELVHDGGSPPAAPDPNTAPPPADPSVRGYLGGVISAEDAAVARYYRALEELDGPRHIEGAAAYMAQTGRRLVRLRHLAGQPLLPQAFETGGL